jgi:hypothetical protein
MLARDSVGRAFAEAQLSLSEIYSSGTNAGVATKKLFLEEGDEIALLVSS